MSIFEQIDSYAKKVLELADKATQSGSSIGTLFGKLSAAFGYDPQTNQQVAATPAVNPQTGPPAPGTPPNAMFDWKTAAAIAAVAGVLIIAVRR